MPSGAKLSALFPALILAAACPPCLTAQEKPAVPPVDSSSQPQLTRRSANAPKADAPQRVALSVPKGSALEVVLDKEVRVRKVGERVHGRVAEPVYAFDKLVIPVGTEVAGKITELHGVSAGARTLDGLNAEFSPPRKVQVEFDDIVLASGRHVPVETTMVQGTGATIGLVSAADREKKNKVRDAASQKVKEAKEEAKRNWNDAMKQAHEPGRIHRLRRWAEMQLPFHPQYIPVGTVYLAELNAPLDFGSEPLKPELATSLNEPPPAGSLVHARLMTALSSATTQKGEAVEAVLTQPLFDGDRLILPQGSRLRGSVGQVRPARRFARNGLLRMVFHEVALPDGVEQKVNASLEGVQTNKGQDVTLDSEGGAEANSPKTRYLSTGISVGLAVVSAGTDRDAPQGDVAGNTSNRVAGGAGGFKLVGIAVGIFVHSQPLGMAMGAYGASVSVYDHFLARGRDLVFPKYTAMNVAIGPPMAGTNESSEPVKH
jgi:type IV secretory pathway VirB10-like protein